MSDLLPFSEIETFDWEKVWVIGGGTSLDVLSYEDAARLPGIKVGANKSAWLYPCDALFTLDQNFAKNHRQDIVDFVERGGDAYLAMSPNETGHKAVPGATYLVLRRSPGLSRNPADIYGANSGFGALGLAYLKGAKQINLLGFDMRYGEDGKTHFHGGYPWHGRRNGRLMAQWTKAFTQAATQLERSGVKVINYIGKPRSLIHDFEERPIEALCAKSS